MLLLSKRIKEVEAFEVMEILKKAEELERKGKKVVHFEIGEPDLELDDELRKVAVESIKKVKYTPSQGKKELIEKICTNVNKFSSYEIKKENVVVTGGVSLGFLYVMSCIIDPLDEVIITKPHYPCYPNFIKFFGGKPIKIELNEKFEVDTEALKEKINKKTKAILINTPMNPTGTYFGERNMKEICEIAEDYNVYLISDEIYSKLAFDRKRSPSVLEYMSTDKAIMLDGFSKLHAMTGLRIGYVVASKEIVDSIVKLQQNFYISPSSVAQDVAIKALDIEEKLREKFIKIYRKRRDFVVKRLKDIGFEFVEPRAAFYVFPKVRGDSREFARNLLIKEGVALAPGEAFGCGGYVRISYSTSMEDIELGLERIERFVCGG